MLGPFNHLDRRIGLQTVRQRLLLLLLLLACYLATQLFTTLSSSRPPASAASYAPAMRCAAIFTGLPAQRRVTASRWFTAAGPTYQ